jgi:hypothetical protein
MIMKLTSELHHTQAIQVAFDPKTLASLISAGKLHASDFSCLNQESKQNVWSLLRNAAASKLSGS